MRGGEFVQFVVLLAIWWGAIWIGLDAINRGDHELLGYYVFVASTAIAAFTYWLYRQS